MVFNIEDRKTKVEINEPSGEITAEALILYGQLAKKYNTEQIYKIANLLGVMTKIDINS